MTVSDRIIARIIQMGGVITRERDGGEAARRGGCAPR
jgi:hypothetical protein